MSQLVDSQLYESQSQNVQRQLPQLSTNNKNKKGQKKVKKVDGSSILINDTVDDIMEEFKFEDKRKKPVTNKNKIQINTDEPSEVKFTQEWTCGVCTLQNSINKKQCSACKNPQTKSKKISKIKEETQMEQIQPQNTYKDDIKKDISKKDPTNKEVIKQAEVKKDDIKSKQRNKNVENVSKKNTDKPAAAKPIAKNNKNGPPIKQNGKQVVVIEKVSDEQAYVKIQEYLKAQNRPFNTQTICDNLKTRIGLSKDAVLKVIKKLVSNGLVSEKLYGKIAIYTYDQNQFELLEPQQIEVIKSNLEVTKQSLVEMKEAKKQYQNQLNQILVSLTNQQLKLQISKSMEQLTQLQLKLLKFENNSEVLVDEDVMDQTIKKRVEIEKELKKRKNIFKEMLDSISEQMEIKPAILMDQTGLEFPKDFQAESH